MDKTYMTDDNHSLEASALPPLMDRDDTATTTGGMA